MKNPFLFLLPIALLIASCSASVNSEEGPEDLEGKRTLLETKQSELRELQTEIADLQKEIESLDPSAKERTLITTDTVEPMEFKHFVEIQGSIQTDDIVYVSSETGGRILELNVSEGQNINKGQLIARLDLEQVNKQIAELETSLELAQEVYERQKRLWEQNIGSEIQYLEAENNVKRLEKSLETLEYQYTKSKLYAPISGVVDVVMLKAGEMAGPGSPIVQILNTRNVMVVADVPENYIQSIKKGEQVTVKLPALQEERMARVTEIGRTINAANRTFHVEIDLDNRSGVLKPNLLATVLVNDYTVENAIAVPIELVQQEVGGKSFVYVVGGEGKELYAKKVYVEPGRSYQGDIIIKSGLEGGEVIVIEGARGLTSNELITTR
ncbi:MAG: efflux RND transporter periplasmic adaptor subunit [Bacteroidetes bacterium]|nr:efflux RND transporter periplasmic adaptor subunit [Bacteroidota bacterium]